MLPERFTSFESGLKILKTLLTLYIFKFEFGSNKYKRNLNLIIITIIKKITNKC